MRWPTWRVQAARLIVWREALAYLRKQRRDVLRYAVLPFGLLLVAVHVPWLPVPTYERGLVTGVMVTALVATVTWLVWVPSGLALRLNGAFAEDFTTELLRTHRNVHAVVASLKVNGYDIDHVAITRAGIVAVETKWHATRPKRGQLEADAYSAARSARSLRLSLRDSGVPDSLFTAAVVLRGPGAGELDLTTLPTPLGDVLVVGGEHAAAWLDTLATGPVGPDFAERLRSDLERTASTRDARIDAGPVLRYLARVR